MYEKDHESKLLATSMLFYWLPSYKTWSWKMKVPVEGKKHGINSSPVGTPLQYSCLENPMDGGAWWAAVYGVPQSRTQLKWLSSSSSSSLTQEQWWGCGWRETGSGDTIVGHTGWLQDLVKRMKDLQSEAGRKKKKEKQVQILALLSSCVTLDKSFKG